MNAKKLLALWGLKWNPFSPDVPREGLLVTPKIEHFAWRVEQLVQEGGFALVTGDSGTGKSVALRIVAGRLSALRDVTVGEVAEAIVAADFYYEEGKNGAYTPVLRDVEVRNVTSRKSKYAFLLRGFEDSPVTNVRVSDCTFDGVQSPDVLEGVRDLVLKNVKINGRVRNETITR